MKYVDLRSDTLTTPTLEMREAMYRAEVGDDVYGEDPTVIKLEEMGANKLGFEAGLFVTSGTMGNLVALLTHVKRGDEILVESQSHIFYNEVGGMAALAGAQPFPLIGNRGKLTPKQIKEGYRGYNIHFPNTSLLCLENSHNRGGGSVTTPDEMVELVNCAQELGLKIHVDGARIFNASRASKCDVKELVKGADSVQFCLSKGLSAPMGSLLVGSKDFIAQARKWRKMVGGGPRQIGIMAAAGIVALEQMTDRLDEDHRLARKLADGLAQLPNISVNPQDVETNILVIQLDEKMLPVSSFMKLLDQKGVKVNPYSGSSIRLVTHKDVSEEGIDYALSVFEELLG